MSRRSFWGLGLALTTGFVLGEVGLHYHGLTAAEASQVTISYGDQGTAVKTLQQDLLDAGFDPQGIDGIFGPNTLSALNGFQKVEGLPTSQIVDQTTWDALASPKFYTYQSTSSSRVIGTYSDYQTAVQSLVNIPGGAVKNSKWEFEYIQPTFYTYASVSSNAVVGKFGTLQDAINSLAMVPGGVVKNASWQYVYIRPSVLYYTYNNVNSNQIIHVFTNQTSAKQSIADIPGGVVKNSQWQYVYINPIYYTYANSGSNQILGKYATLQSAINSLYYVPEGVVKNSDWQFVYIRPKQVYYTYDSAGSNQITGMYTSLSDAIAALSNVPGGVVKNSSWSYVYEEPVYYTYSNASSNTILDKFTNLTDAINSLSNVPGGVVKNSQWQYVYQNVDYTSVDLRYSSPSAVNAQQIDSWLGKHSSPLVGLGAAYVNAQNEYGTNATYLLSHSILESAWGASSIAQAKNNIFGYGAYNSNPGADAGVFPSEEYAIAFQAWMVRNTYLNPGATYYNDPTLTGMNVNYATDPSWAQDIGNLMNEYVSQTGGSFSGYKVFSQSNSPSSPKSTSEPVYTFNGALGTANTVPYYSGVPVFSSMSNGENEMFFGDLSTSNEAQSLGVVATLQQFLNAKDNAGLQVDGSYGPLTETAVKNYQSAHNLSVTGVCDYGLWQQVVSPQPVIPQGSTISIDSVKEGMFNGIVTEWYHVTDKQGGISGWVNSDYVNFSNVNRIYSTSGDYLTLDGVVVHNGTYVVVANGTVQFCDETGAAYSAPVTSNMKLTVISH